MELLKPKDNLSFKIGDVKFFVRSTATVADKLEMDMVGDYVNGSFRVSRADLFKKIVELFVTGWEGVTENGTPVPYSFATLVNRLPYDVTQDWLLRLGAFIADELHLFPVPHDAEKNA